MGRPTRESLLEELRALAARRGPDVTVFTFRQETGIAAYYIYDRWGNWTNLRRAAGLPVRSHPGPIYSDDELLAEYHRTAVAVDDYPTHAEFNRLSDRCFHTLETRFGNTKDVHHQYREWLAAHCPGESPKFLEGCPVGFVPTVLPGLNIIDEDWFRRATLGVGLWLLIVLTDVMVAKFISPGRSLSRAGPLIMALLPPAQLFDHPADLVIDVFGTFLGKRSERMVVRWREPAGQASAILPAVISTAETIADSDAPIPAMEDNSPQKPHAHAADQAAAELLQLWASQAETRLPEPRLMPTARLTAQLDSLVDVPVSRGDKLEWQERAVPMSRLRSVTVSGRGVTVSSDLIAALVERGIALSFLSGRGRPVAQLSAPGLGGTVQTRRSQLAAYNSSLGVQLAVEFIRGKLRNQKHLLQYSGKYLKSAEPARYERLVKKIAAIANMRKQVADFTADDMDRVRDKLMGYEGSGARVYWEGVAIILEGRVEFPGRQTRGATDPVNSAMNYGYGILYSQVSAAIVNAGLEMYAGFLHVDRPGKPALVLDLVEEFRAPVVDRAVLAIVNQGTPLETDDHGLTPATRKLVASRVLERLSTPVPYEGKRWELGTIIQNQARHLAVAVRGERIYRAFASRW